jgi:hypothetical protein
MPQSAGWALSISEGCHLPLPLSLSWHQPTTRACLVLGASKSFVVGVGVWLILSVIALLLLLAVNLVRTGDLGHERAQRCSADALAVQPLAHVLLVELGADPRDLVQRY